MTPNLNQLRAGKSGCPSDFALDRLHNGACDGTESGKLNDHVKTCNDCQARMSERASGFDAIPEANPVKMLSAVRRGIDEPAQSIGSGLLGWTRRLLGPMLVIATASVLLIVRKPPPPVEGPIVVRAKGTPALHVFRQAGDKAEEVPSGAPFHAGDKLRFVVDLPEAGAVRVMGVEANREVFTAWPLDPRQPAVRLAGSGIALPGAVQLDDAKGRESLYLVVCETEPRLATCHAQGDSFVCAGGCEVSPFVVEKAP